MRRIPLLLAALTLAAADLEAQSNTVSGLDGRLVRIDSPRVWGRRGAAYPNGEFGMSSLNELCNPGRVNIPWFAPMAPDHPKFSFLVTRLSDGRMVQVSDWSYLKHAFLSLNDQGPSCGGTCTNTASGSQMYPHCYDVYSNSNNASRTYLGPPEELDPWLGVWNPIGSYFDRGDPNVGSPGNRDGQRSPINVGSDPVKNRVTIQEQEVVVPNSRFFYAIQVVHQGEAGGNRNDNAMSRELRFTWNGSSWSVGNVGSFSPYGSILQHWPGATVAWAGNGGDDGTFYVAVDVTGPQSGLYHYEYATHNMDNNRGASTLRIPLCAGTAVSNVGFRDIDGNLLNDWTWSKVGDELVFTAPANNPQNWNQLFNFWFDCDAAPVNGQVEIDQARIGPGALTVAVNARVPGGIASNVDLGPGCGAPAPVLAASGLPLIPSAGFQLVVTAAPNAGVLLFHAQASANLPLGNGCTQYLDNGSVGSHGFLTADGAGNAAFAVPVPNNPSLQGLAVHWQAAELVNGGPLFGMFELTNGLRTTLGCR